MKEVKLGRMLGPFPVQSINPLICSPVGMVEKKNSMDMCRITHLSHPWGVSINSFIDPEDCKTNYQTLDMALKLVAKHEQRCFMVKEDFKSVFCNVPMCFSDFSLLGIKVHRQYFIDCCLPFGAAASCQVFEKIATLIHWIAQKRTGLIFMHYLDDFFIVHELNHACSYAMGTFKQVCYKIGMPISPYKLVGPVQVIGLNHQFCDHGGKGTG